MAPGPRRVPTWSALQHASVVDASNALDRERVRALAPCDAVAWVREHAQECLAELEDAFDERRVFLIVESPTPWVASDRIEAFDLVDQCMVALDEAEPEPEEDIEPPPVVLRRVRLHGALFDTNKTFVLPSAMYGIRGLKRYYDHHSGMSLLVTGHSDTVGGPAHNEALSRERAEAMAAYLIEDVDDWVGRYGYGPVSTAWGTTEDQHMLSALPSAETPYYAGPVHGVVDGPTRAAVQSFQSDAGLVVDGVCGPNTRRALVERYMALDETTLPDGVDLQTHGCGEHHLRVPTSDGVDEPLNRRVEVFLFPDGIDPPPRPTCGGCAEYPQWLAKVVETVDFSDEPGWLDVGVFDEHGGPISAARVHVDGPAQDLRHSDVDGHTRFHVLNVGIYRVRVEAPGFDVAEFDVGVTPGEPPEGVAYIAAKSEDSAFVGDGASVKAKSGGTSHGAGQVGPNTAQAQLASTDAIVHIVGQVPDGPSPPGIHQRVREEALTMTHGMWQRVQVHCRWGTKRLAVRPDVHGKVVFPFDAAGKDPNAAPAKHGTLEAITARMTGTGATADVHYTIREPQPPGTSGNILVGPSVDAGKTREVKISTRLRTSLWASPNYTTNANLSGMTGIDDLSLLVTYVNGHFGRPGATSDPMALAAEWDDIYRPGANTSPKEKDFYNHLIGLCHKKGVQALVGFQHAGNTNTKEVNGVPTTFFPPRTVSFRKWVVACNKLSTSKKEQAIDLFIERLVSRCESELPDYDGISFDIEHTPSVHAMPTEAQAEFFTYFYRAAAKRLVASGKFIAVAVGSFDNQVASVNVKDLQKRFEHGSTIEFARAHPYQMAKGHANMILRPMAYGPYSSQQGNKEQLQWHADILEYVYGYVGLAPDQFQLGFDPTTPLPDRCKNLLRPNQTGVARFALGKAQFWPFIDAMDKQLNPDERPPGTKGQPLQCPRP